MWEKGGGGRSTGKKTNNPILRRSSKLKNAISSAFLGDRETKGKAKRQKKGGKVMEDKSKDGRSDRRRKRHSLVKKFHVCVFVSSVPFAVFRKRRRAVGHCHPKKGGSEWSLFPKVLLKNEFLDWNCIGPNQYLLLLPMFRYFSYGIISVNLKKFTRN